jgi:hypothetical protein
LSLKKHKLQKEKKLADKAKAAFEAAEAKMNNLKGRGDAKAFEAEKERNMLHERYLQAKKQADTAIQDATEKNKYNIMEHLCDYIDLYYEFFKSGTSAIEQLQSKLDDYRNAAQKVNKNRTLEFFILRSSVKVSNNNLTFFLLRNGWNTKCVLVGL